MATFWLDVPDETIRACAAHGRTDLAHELQHRRAQLLDPRLKIEIDVTALIGSGQKDSR